MTGLSPCHRSYLPSQVYLHKTSPFSRAGRLWQFVNILEFFYMGPENHGPITAQNDSLPRPGTSYRGHSRTLGNHVYRPEKSRPVHYGWPAADVSISNSPPQCYRLKLALSDKKATAMAQKTE
ncbi:hypothetical protein AcV7_002281 [Taiwanofungus camphoratus]|nr:hypothetical protein AcV7_002281 [Antrodia cinnamomea]